MKQYFTIIFSILFYSNIFGQISSSVYNTSDPFYTKTNFDFVDTLNQWTFTIDTSFISDRDTLFKPLARVSFFRISGVIDTNMHTIMKTLWRPNIVFDVFKLKDSSFCIKTSTYIRAVSKCSLPEVGGDILFIGNFIFLNRSLCVSLRPDNSQDYARPLINSVFSNIDLSKINTLQKLIDLLPIKGKML